MPFSVLVSTLLLINYSAHDPLIAVFFLCSSDLGCLCRGWWRDGICKSFCQFAGVRESYPVFTCLVFFSRAFCRYESSTQPRQGRDQEKPGDASLERNLHKGQAGQVPGSCVQAGQLQRHGKSVLCVEARFCPKLRLGRSSYGNQAF